MRTKILILVAFALSSLSTVFAQKDLSNVDSTITGESRIPTTFTRSVIMPVAEDVTVEISHQHRSTGNAGIQEGIKVYGGKGTMYVQTAQPERLMVYSISGQLKVDRQIGEQLTLLSIPQGLYIVKVGNMIHKVIVK